MADQVISKEALEKSLRDHFRDSHLRVTHVEVTIPPWQAFNFTTKVELLDVTVETGSPRKTESVPIFVKKALVDGAYAKVLTDCLTYEREAAFFSMIIPLLRDSSSGSGTCMDFAPLCYHASPLALALENLTVSKRFRMRPNAASGQDLAHVQSGVNALAKMHALSFALKENPELRETITRKYPFLKDMRMGSDGTSGLAYYTTATFRVFREFLEQDGSFPKTAEILKRFEPHVLHVYAEMVKPTEPFNVICHADCWNNNMMFVYPSEDVDFERPLQAILVDFQAVRWGPFTTDLLYFIYTSTSMDFRQKHLQEVLSFYYENLSHLMETLGILRPVFTLEQMQEDFSCRRLFGLLWGLPMFASNLIPPDKIPKTLLKKLNFETFQDLVDHFIGLFKVTAGHSEAVQLAEFIEDFRGDIHAYLEKTDT